MLNYVASYEFNTQVNRDAWVDETAMRFGYEWEEYFVGVDFAYTFIDEAEFSEEAQVIGNNEDPYGRTGRREMMKYLYEDEPIVDVVIRCMQETAIAFGRWIAT